MGLTYEYMLKIGLKAVQKKEGLFFYYLKNDIVLNIQLE